MGCMGRISRKTISPDAIKNKVISAMYDAVYNDSRGNQRLPVGARVDVSYMLTPLVKIDTSGRLANGEEFDNRTMGCIAKNKSGNMTTYLPRVLEGTDWLKFATSLAQKSWIADGYVQLFMHMIHQSCQTTNSLFCLYPHPGREYGEIS